MSKIYKCDICGTPYGTGSFKRSTDYAVIGVKDFNDVIIHKKVWDVCPECNKSILDFIDSRTKKEEEV